MERKRIEKLVVLLLIGILMPVSLFPFPVHAETIDSHIRGRNYTYEPITYNEIQVSSTTYYKNIGVFHITFELDDEYIGYVLPNYSIQYDNYFYGASNPNWGTLTETFDRRIFVNGSSFSFDVTVNWNSININSAPSGDPFNYDSYTITSSDVTKYADIDSLDQIINILQDNQDIITDIYSELQTVVTNTSLANTYLETLTKLKQWHVPIESFSYAYALLNKYPNKVITHQNMYYFDYPVFQLNSGDEIFNYYINTNTQYIEWILGINKNVPSDSIFRNYVTSSEQFYIREYTALNQNYGDTNSDSYMRIIKLKIYSNGNTNAPLIISVNSNTRIIPIYMRRSDQNINVGTDFALIYGLSNQLLDDLHIIANGTSQSSSASGSLDQTTSQFSDDANDLVTIEESFNDSMNDSLENVSPVFNMGSSFLTSANWVSQQFNRIVNNTPFASLITFGLTLGLGLLIIGKVRK